MKQRFCKTIFFSGLVLVACINVGCHKSKPCGNGVLDEGEACEGDVNESCRTACDTPGQRSCDPTRCRWQICISTAQEICNNKDDDCDGATDETFDCAPQTRQPCQTADGAQGIRNCTEACTWETGCKTHCEQLRNISAPLLNEFDKTAKRQFRDRHQRESRELLDHARKKMAPLRQCLSAGRGAWMLMPLKASIQREGAEGYTLDAEFRLTYLSAEGQTITATKTQKVEVEILSLYSDTVQSATTFDFDNNGVHELILHRRYAQSSDQSDNYQIWTARDQKITPYSKVDQIDIVEITDYDKDGRPDIVSKRNYWSAEPCWGDDEGDTTLGLPRVLYHSRADGSFSAADGVAAQYLKQQCPQNPPVLLKAADYDWEIDALQRISCARLWGNTANGVKKQLTREWKILSPPKDKSCGYPLDRFLKWAEIEPPVQFGKQ